MTEDTPQITLNVEHPDPEKLRIYGDFLFLAMRSERHRAMSVANLRSAFEAPIELGQYRIFRFDEVPRGLFTWAMLSPEAEKRYVTGGILDPSDWRSGPRLWLIDLIAPYRGLTASISRWIMVPGNVTDTSFMFRRVSDKKSTRRIVHVDFHRPDGKAEILTEADFA